MRQSEGSAEEMRLAIRATDLELGPDLAAALERSAVGKSALVELWRDYWDLGTLMSQAPKWWIERIAKHTDAEWSEGS